jgi:hypothetical protein
MRPMVESNSEAAATLLDILIDGFEKNEVLRGYHWRDLPLPNAGLAAAKFDVLLDEARRWKGEPSRHEVEEHRRRACWPDLEIRQAGRGIRVFVRAPRFESWWHEPKTWVDDPMGAMRVWVQAEES